MENNITHEIDARGLDCPAPVLKTKHAIEKYNAMKIKITVDNSAAVENVSRFLDYNNYSISTETDGKFFVVTGIRQDSAGMNRNSVSDTEASTKTSYNKKSGSEILHNPEEKSGKNMKKDTDHQKIMVMIASGEMGKGDDELGQKLMKNFIKTLKEMGDDLWRLVFVNGGVKFAVKGSEVISDLKELENDGISILVCGTCLNHFKILKDKQVGETTNMLDIVTSMQFADKVINL